MTSRRTFPPWLPFVVAGLAAVALFVRALGFEVVYDGVAILYRDTRLQEITWANVGRILTQGYWYPQVGDLYRPVTTLSFFLNQAVHGDAVAGVRLVNLGLHVASVLLLGVWIRRAAGGVPGWKAGALVGMLAFAVHPVGVEAVVNIVGRADGLVTVALLGVGLVAWRARPDWRTGGLVALLALVAVLSKEHGVMAGPVALWIAWVRRPPDLTGRWRERAHGLVRWGVREGWPFAPAAVVFVIVRLHFGRFGPFPGQIFVDNPITAAPTWIEGWLTAWRVFAAYLGVVVAPFRLSADDSFAAETLWRWEPAVWGTWQAFAGLLAGVGLAAVAWSVRRSRPVLAVAAGWFLLVVLPTSNLVVPIGSIRAERFLYTPLAGAALALGVVVTRAWTRPAWRVVALAVAGIWVGLLAGRTHIRIDDWRDGHAFWSAVHRDAPESFRGLRGLAREEAARDPGESGLRRAVELGRAAVAVLERPEVPQAGRDAWVYFDLARHELGLAELLERRGGPNGDLDAAAERSVRTGIALQEASEAEAGRHYAVLGVTLGDLGTTPDVARHLVLGRLLHRRGEFDAAARELEIGLRRNPLDPEVPRLWAEALERAGRMEEALAASFRALILEPQDPRILEVVARLLGGAPERAVALQRGPYGFYLDTRVAWVRAALLDAMAGLERDLEARGVPARVRELRGRFVETFRVGA